MKKFLICEAGLHGDGDKQYYLCLIKALRAMWSGWPHIVFKMQHWCDPDGRWAKRVSQMHGRPPMKSVLIDELVEIGREVVEAGFGYAVTFHDRAGLKNAFNGIIPPLTHLKLGAFDFKQPLLRYAAYSMCSRYNLGLIASVFGTNEETLEGILQSEGFQKDTVFLQGESRYPSNKTMPSCNLIKDYNYGYSAHNVPGIAYSHVLDALANGANVIELHVTMRPYSMRPLPGDMCVSLDIDTFMKIALMCGETWAN